MGTPLSERGLEGRQGWWGPGKRWQLESQAPVLLCVTVPNQPPSAHFLLCREGKPGFFLSCGRHHGCPAGIQMPEALGEWPPPVNFGQMSDSAPPPSLPVSFSCAPPHSPCFLGSFPHNPLYRLLISARARCQLEARLARDEGVTLCPGVSGTLALGHRNAPPSVASAAPCPQEVQVPRHSHRLAASSSPCSSRWWELLGLRPFPSFGDTGPPSPAA